MVDITKYVNFDVKKMCDIKEKVRFSILAEILESCTTEKEL